MQHTSSDCFNVANGPVDVAILWNNGEQSALSGNWSAPLIGNGAANNTRTVVSGLGAGQRVRIDAAYDLGTPQNFGACLGPGVVSGTGVISSAAFV
ncbi:hypothetical protein [Nocardia sp. NPDC049149]|uniref:hypothetical protein n=1 Tax=Nocardia sp. NPDC049149 TaxID=3364315 RepID=UPI00371E5AE5